MCVFVFVCMCVCVCVCVCVCERETEREATLRKTPERLDGAYMGFTEHINTILNWTELMWTSRLQFSKR